MSRILVLRPEPGASATVERARKRGLAAITIPLFQVEPVKWQAPDASAFDGLLLTSANAVRCGGEELHKLRALKAYAVGEATAAAARDAGFDIAASGESGVDRLLGSMEGDLRLLHPCGEDHREPTDTRQKITAVTVYRSKALEVPDLSGIGACVALIHSPRAGARFAELVSDRARISVAAISEAAAEAVGEGWHCVEAAHSPTDEALLALAARLCNNSQPK
jgi:uroporphyrinogen-III synthase